ncbi:semaphorin-7A-like [Hoplias malabaricus]|uniref:semaphorin-7A-like n=1 Tax=Hoplias malabaricus TaxID=27720 RepID=UPI0034625BC8
MFLGVLRSFLLALLWSHRVHTELEDHHHPVARIIITQKEANFSTFIIPQAVLKLVKDPFGSKVYAGGLKGLYELDKGKEKSAVPVDNEECNGDTSMCSYEISVLTEGRNGNPLFMCRKMKTVDETKCCTVTSELKAVDCFTMKQPVQINEPSLYNGDSLFFTISGENKPSTTKGLYKLNRVSHTWPQRTDKEQKYIKIIGNESSTAADGKLYFFYIEKNSNNDPESPVWIPRISQYCMADKGGNKNHLQFSWTSMLTARLFCGDTERRVTYTELLDVTALETEDPNNSLVYALFKNAYDVTAICVYNTSHIKRIFTSSRFKNNGVPSDGLSGIGECVSDSIKTSQFLKFMEKRPEMEDWIMPEGQPMLVSHRQYTHLQVDRVTSADSTVLLLALASGKVHKVLEQDGGIFIIAEYQPFRNRTQIHSMLLDRSTKNLYVSSKNMVVQINLGNCSIYGNNCESCVTARDPYCRWTSYKCSANEYNSQDMRSGNHTVCGNGPEYSKVFAGPQSQIVPWNSRYYLKCSTPSQQASYFWNHEGRRKECVFTGQDCLLLIESMSEDYVGSYMCQALENGQERTLVSYMLLNSGTPPGLSPITLACLLSLISLVFYHSLD